MTLSVRIERDAAHIFINFPHLNNGMSLDAIQEFTNLVGAQAERTDLRFLVIHGAPEWFCIGASGETLAEAIRLGRAQRVSLTTNFQNAVAAILSCGLLTVAVLDGLATGAGLDLALACDLRLATPLARMSLLYSKLGLVPDTGFGLLAERLIGKDPLLLYAESPVLRAPEMQSFGLAETAPDDATDPAALTTYLSRRFRFDAWALRRSKEAAFQGRMTRLAPDLLRAADAQAEALDRAETQRRVLRSAGLQTLAQTASLG